MLPYWLLFSTFAVGALGHEWRNQQRSFSPILFLAILGVALFVGLRWEVGTDWEGYQWIFHGLAWADLETVLTRDDVGFHTLVWIVHQFGLEIWALNLICATVFSLGLLAFARQQPNPWLAVAVAIPYLVIVVAMSGTRQATAIGLIFFGLSALSRGSLVRFVLWCGVAMLFHASAALMVPLGALSYTRNRLQAVLLLALTAIPAYFLLGGAYEVYIERYTSREIESQGTLYRLLLNAIPAILFLWRPHMFNVSDHQKIFWRNLSLIAIASLPLLYVIPSSTALDRLALYVIPLQIFVFSRLPFGSRQSEYLIVVAAVLAAQAVLLYGYFNFSTHGQYWLPYQMYPLFG